MVTIEKCPCGRCSDYHLVGIGKFVQGSGFKKEEAQHIADLLNADVEVRRAMAKIDSTEAERAEVADIIRTFNEILHSTDNTGPIDLRRSVVEFDDTAEIAEYLRSFSREDGMPKPAKYFMAEAAVQIEAMYHALITAANMLEGDHPPTSAVPEGYVLVPAEPTPDMLAEIHLVEHFSERALVARYKAMLSAAPQPGGQSDG